MNPAPAHCPHPANSLRLAELWNEDSTILVSYHLCQDCGAVAAPTPGRR